MSMRISLPVINTVREILISSLQRLEDHPELWTRGVYFLQEDGSTEFLSTTTLENLVQYPETEKTCKMCALGTLAYEYAKKFYSPKISLDCSRTVYAISHAVLDLAAFDLEEIEPYPPFPFYTYMNKYRFDSLNSNSLYDTFFGIEHVNEELGSGYEQVLACYRLAIDNLNKYIYDVECMP